MRAFSQDRRSSRRSFIGHAARGFAGAGVLGPLWKAVDAHGDVSAAYPDELLSIEVYTRGRIKAGDEITADNVEWVRDLLEPAKLHQVMHMGRRLRVAPTTTDILAFSPPDYIEATLRHQGQARFDGAGNVVTADGQPWIGGHPFPGSVNGLELFAGLTLSWGRYDASVYAIKEYDLSAEGRIEYQYDLVWAEMSPVGRLSLSPRPYWPAHQDKLRFQSVIFTAPQSESGTSYLNVWPYDQNQFPSLYGYVPHFRRIRQFPTSQRFEPLVPGSALYLSDAWAAGDPLHSWGNYRVVGRGPMLAGVSGGWNPAHPNWEHGTHGGPNGQTFWDTTVELVPEAIIVDAEPVRFPRAPVSRKRVWFDARNQMPLAMVTYDRRGEPFRSFDGCYSRYVSAGHSFMAGGHPYWSWSTVHAYEFQTGRMTRLEQVKSLGGQHSTSVNDPGTYERYLTQAALARFGRV